MASKQASVWPLKHGITLLSQRPQPALQLATHPLHLLSCHMHRLANHFCHTAPTDRKTPPPVALTRRNCRPMLLRASGRERLRKKMPSLWPSSGSSTTFKHRQLTYMEAAQRRRQRQRQTSAAAEPWDLQLVAVGRSGGQPANQAGGRRGSAERRGRAQPRRQSCEHPSDAASTPVGTTL